MIWLLILGIVCFIGVPIAAAIWTRDAYQIDWDLFDIDDDLFS